jgi:hypothetical protein
LDLADNGRPEASHAVSGVVVLHWTRTTHRATGACLEARVLCARATEYCGVCCVVFELVCVSHPIPSILIAHAARDHNPSYS